MLKNNPLFLDKLFEEIKNKIRDDNPDKSYTAFLSSSGIENITKKIVEEAFEVSLAAIDNKNTKNNKERIVAETADLFYHIFVLLANKKIELQDIITELDKRNKTKGLSDKAIAKNKIKLNYEQ